MNTVFTNELFMQESETISDNIEKILTKYHRGMCTKDEVHSRFSSLEYKYFPRFIEGLGLKWVFTDETYNGFEEDFHSLLTTGDLKDENHIPWLFHEHFNERNEASKEDKINFLRLMQSLYMTPEEFIPCPSSIISPRKTIVHGWNRNSTNIILFECVDDSGLLSDPNPIGKTFILKNTLGLKAVLRIKEDRRENLTESKMEFDEQIYVTNKGLYVLQADFLTEGYIEGYTSKEEREMPEILIRLNYEKKIHSLSFWQTPEDFRAYQDFLLWQEYFQWQHNNYLREYDKVEALIKASK